MNKYLILIIFLFASGHVPAQTKNNFVPAGIFTGRDFSTGSLNRNYADISSVEKIFGCNLVFNIFNTNPVCFNDSTAIATIHVSGGTQPYTFTWMPFGGTDSTAYNLPGGNYQVVVIDSNGCMDTAFIEIINPEPVARIFIISICEGDSFFAAGAWQTQAGVYSDTAISYLGCDSINYSMMNILPLPLVSINLTLSDTLCITSGLQTLSGGSPVFGTYSGQGVSGTDFDPLGAGFGWNYITYSYTASTGCVGSATDSVFVDICSGLDGHSTFPEIHLFPIPAIDNIELWTSTKYPEFINIMNASGAIVFVENHPTTHQVLNIKKFPNGFYFIEAGFPTGIQTFKFLKQE